MTHYYSETQDSDLKPVMLSFKIGTTSLNFLSGSGVFSKKKLDKGSELLIKKSILKHDWKILDLGCGIGVVGIFLKKMHPNIKLLMSDVNKRAVMLARKNLKINNLEGKIIFSDGFKNIKEEFDSIIFNPPQVAGKQTCFRLFEEAHEALVKGGLFQIVARHNKGGKSYSEKMNSLFDNVKHIAISSGYRLYVSKKN